MYVYNYQSKQVGSSTLSIYVAILMTWFLSVMDRFVILKAYRENQNWKGEI